MWLVVKLFFVVLISMKTKMSQMPRNVYRLMMEAGAKLEAKATTIATACVFYHKFIELHKSHLDRFCECTTAAACVYLAGKTEEDMMKIRDVVNVFHAILHPEDPQLEVDNHYWNLRDGVNQLELLVLRSLQFQVTLEHPHKYLLNYLKSLEGWINRDKWNPSQFAGVCWTFLQDCYVQPTLILGNKPELVAIAIIYLVAQVQNVDVMEGMRDIPHGFHWWDPFMEGLKESQLIGLCNQIFGNYSLNE